MQNHHHIHSYHPMAQPNLHILSQQLAEPVNQHMQTLVELGAAIASVHTKLAQQHEAALAENAQQHEAFLAENAQQHEAFLAELDHKHKAYLAKKAQQHEGFLTLQAQQYKKTRSIGLLRPSWTFDSTWVGRLQPSCLAHCERSFCFRYSVRALGLWQ